MPSPLFSVDAKQLVELRKQYKRAPRDFARAAAGVLNHHAFGSRKTQIREINSSMTVRNPRFVSSKIQVTKARGRLPIRTMQSTSGSVTGPRFSGWEEQQTGNKTKLTRTITKSARGGNWKSQVKPKARLKSSAKFLRPEQFHGRNQKAKFMFMMRVIATRSGNVNLLITNRQGKLDRGLYRFNKSRRKFSRLQSFDNPTQPRRNKWHSKAVDRYFKRANLSQVWKQQLKRQLKFK